MARAPVSRFVLDWLPVGRSAPLKVRKARRPHGGPRVGAGSFEQLERREVFNATYHGGFLVQHVEAQPVFLGQAWTQNSTLIDEAASIDKFVSYLVQSPYMDVMTDAGYNVGQGTAVAGARVTGAQFTSTTVTDAGIRATLQQAIDLSLVSQPTRDRVYLVYIPSGIQVSNGGATSVRSFLGYHGAFAGTDRFGVPYDLHYVVVPHPGAPNLTSASQGFPGMNEVQTLTLGGAAGGVLTPSLNGVAATTTIARIDEVQTLTLGGADGGTVQLSFGGVAGTAATELTFRAGISPAPEDVQAHLNSITSLNSQSTVAVTGPVGGPFTIAFSGNLSGVNVDPIGVAATAGGATGSITTQTNGSMPTETQVQASLASITGLAGNVTVHGDAGGPFTITFAKTLGNVPVINVSHMTGGLTAAVSTPTNGISTDLDQMTAVTAHELAEAVTDPDVNYKTLGWYDIEHNIEIADILDLQPTKVPGITTRLGPDNFLAPDLYNRAFTLTKPDTTSIPIFTTVNGQAATAVTGVTITPLSLSRALISWNPVDGGASGYRIFLVNGTQSTLLARVPGTVTSTVLSGLPPLQNLTFRVEAYNAVHTADSVDMVFSMPLPDVVAPRIISVVTNPAAPQSSAMITWTNNGGAAGYRIYMIVGTRKTLVASLGETATSATISGLPVGATVSFRVQAFRASQTADSATVSLKLAAFVLKAPVVTATAVNGVRTNVQLKWNAVAGTQGYRVYRLSAGKRVLVSTLAASAVSTRIGGLPAGTQFLVEAFRGTQRAASKWVHL